jgi:hypothetical protein
MEMSMSPWSAPFIGRMFEATSEIFYILMLILLGKGYTVTRARLRSRSVVKVTVFMSLYCVTYIALFTYERQVKDVEARSVLITDSGEQPTYLFITFVYWTTVLWSGESSLRIRVPCGIWIAGSAISRMDDICLWFGFYFKTLSGKEWVLSAIFLLFVVMVIFMTPWIFGYWFIITFSCYKVRLWSCHHNT